MSLLSCSYGYRPQLFLPTCLTMTEQSRKELLKASLTSPSGFWALEASVAFRCPRRRRLRRAALAAHYWILAVALVADSSATPLSRSRSRSPPPHRTRTRRKRRLRLRPNHHPSGILLPVNPGTGNRDLGLVTACVSDGTLFLGVSVEDLLLETPYLSRCARCRPQGVQ